MKSGDCDKFLLQDIEGPNTNAESTRGMIFAANNK